MQTKKTVFKQRKIDEYHQRVVKKIGSLRLLELSSVLQIYQTLNYNKSITTEIINTWNEFNKELKAYITRTIRNLYWDVRIRIKPLNY